MAQKAAKERGRRNAETLNRTHLISLAVNGLFLLLRAIIFRSSFSRGTLLKYIIFASPAAVIEFFFERNSRPQYVGNELKTGGEDLDAKGLTEYMWDVLYWTWINTGLVALFGDRLWWAMLVVPVYSAWLAYTTYGSVRQGLGLGGMAPAAEEGSADSSGATSKRQQKMEKRGGKMVYR